MDTTAEFEQGVTSRRSNFNNALKKFTEHINLCQDDHEGGSWGVRMD
jgi:hypothetical protein